MPLAIEDWLQSSHSDDYFTKLKAHDDYKALCGAFDLDNNDDASAKAIEGFHKVYQAVYRHKNIKISVIYRLHELEANATKAVERMCSGNTDKSFMDHKLDFCDFIHNHLLLDTLDNAALEKAFQKSLLLAKNLQGDLSKNDTESMRRNFNALVKKTTSVYPDVRSKIDNLVASFPEKIKKTSGKDLSKSQMETLLAKTKELIKSGKPPMDINPILKKEIESLTGVKIDDDYHPLADAISSFSNKVVTIRDIGYDTLLSASNDYFITMANQSKEATEFFGLNKKHHQLTDEGSVYAPQGIGHTRNINMVWMLANMHADRSFVIISPVNDKSKFRRRRNNVLSAFASEIGAAKKQGYRVRITGDNKIYIDPPLPKGSLSKLTFAEIKQDMKSADTRSEISSSFDDMKKEVDDLRSNSEKEKSKDMSSSSSSQVQKHKEKIQEILDEKSKDDSTDTLSNSNNPTGLEPK